MSLPSTTPLWRARLGAVLADHGGLATVARLCDIPQQTLRNHMTRTKRAPLTHLMAVARATGRDYAWLSGMDNSGHSQVQMQAAAGFAKLDVLPYSGLPLASGSTDPQLDRWMICSRALDLAGCLPGDVIEFRMGATPVYGEPVIAQICDQQGVAETVLRLFAPPFLVASSSDPAFGLRPIAIDSSVHIVGGFHRLTRQTSDG